MAITITHGSTRDLPNGTKMFRVNVADASTAASLLAAQGDGFISRIVGGQLSFKKNSGSGGPGKLAIRQQGTGGVDLISIDIGADFVFEITERVARDYALVSLDNQAIFVETENACLVTGWLNVVVSKDAGPAVRLIA